MATTVVSERTADGHGSPPPPRQHQAPPTSLSRYRSVRASSGSSASSSATATTAKTAGTMSLSGRDGSFISQDDRDCDSHSLHRDSASGNSISRSMSRYRKRANSLSSNLHASDSSSSLPPPPVPALPQAEIKPAPTPRDPSRSDHSPPLSRTHTRNESDATVRPPPPRMAERTFVSTDVTAHSPLGSHAPEQTDDATEQQNRDDAAKQAAELARMDAETDRILAAQKKKDLERLQLQLSTQPVKPQKTRSPVFEKFAMLTKGRKNKDGLSPTSPIGGSADIHDSIGHAQSSKRTPANIGIQPGGKGSVPGIDAPANAINAADRNVTVRCRHHTFSIEVNPETTAVDVLFQTSNQMSYDLEISPSNCVVMESIGSMGLERRLRRYEHIRDVMNSWDRDSQNVLVVNVADPSDDFRDLDAASVPKTEQSPAGFQLYMHHANRPGKWNKRYISLLDNGQIISAKKPNAYAGEKDVVNLCTVSDYDIYTPNEVTMRRQLKAPKKYCFAVKSQQRSTIFLNTDNYVQYFSTDDAGTAAKFCENVQAWRSWYLVDRRPEARKTTVPKKSTGAEEKAPQIAPKPHTAKKSVNVAEVDGHRLRVSVDETPYSIGHFEPLLDMKRFDKRLSHFGKDFLPKNQDSATAKTNDTTPSYLKPASDAAFTGEGLLAAGYDEKLRRAQQDNKNGDSGLMTVDEHPAVNDTPAEKPASGSWFPSALEHSAKKRTDDLPARPKTSSGVVQTGGGRPLHPSSRQPPPPLPQQAKLQSRSATAPRGPMKHPNPLSSSPLSGPMPHPHGREMPKPLVNLAPPSIVEPPQHRKGHGIKTPEGLAYLVDAISVSDDTISGKGANSLAVPPRSALRPQRTRSKSSGAATGARRNMIADVPSVPALPMGMVANAGSRNASGGGGMPDFDVLEAKERIARERARQKERERERQREKDREYHAAFNTSTNGSRVGTLKAV